MFWTRNDRRILYAIHVTLSRILEILERETRSVSLAVNAILDGKRYSMLVTILDSQKVLLTATPIDAKGQPTGDAFDAPPVWTTNNATTVSLVNSPDGLTATATAGTIGTVTVTVTGTVKGVSIVGSIDVVVVATGPSVAILVTAGVPEAA